MTKKKTKPIDYHIEGQMTFEDLGLMEETKPNSIPKEICYAAEPPDYMACDCSVCCDPKNVEDYNDAWIRGCQKFMEDNKEILKGFI
jgi:hypothetical protein